MLFCISFRWGPGWPPDVSGTSAGLVGKPRVRLAAVGEASGKTARAHHLGDVRCEGCVVVLSPQVAQLAECILCPEKFGLEAGQGHAWLWVRGPLGMYGRQPIKVSLSPSQKARPQARIRSIVLVPGLGVTCPAAAGNQTLPMRALPWGALPTRALPRPAVTPMW